MVDIRQRKQMPLPGRLGQTIADSHRKRQTRILRTRKLGDIRCLAPEHLGNCIIVIHIALD